MNLIVPLMINVVLAVGALLLKALSLSGALAATVVGFVILHCIGWGGWAVLLLFFLSATILGHVNKLLSDQSEKRIQKKSGPRDWAQVFANGGLAAVAALLYGISGLAVALVMFGASLACATADTFASEAGTLSKSPPISIRTGTIVPKGMSGGITLLGTISSVVGALLIALAWFAACASYHNAPFFFLALIIGGCGIFGSFVDSYLGATVQAHYWDAENKQLTEHKKRNGKTLELCRGISWIDNDTVNFISNAAAVLLASGLSALVL